jgi:hypothetical protein
VFVKKGKKEKGTTFCFLCQVEKKRRKFKKKTKSNDQQRIMLWDMMDRGGSPLFRIRVSLFFSFISSVYFNKKIK